MAMQNFVCLLGAMMAFALGGCASPFDVPTHARSSLTDTMPANASALPSVYRADEDQHPEFVLDSSPESYIQYALFHSPKAEQAYQQWRASAERLPQLAALPDPRLSFGFFLNEVETRVGPQQAKIGIQQTFPWIGKLRDREDAGAKHALAAWYRYQGVLLNITEQVNIALADLSYLDATLQITEDNQSLLTSIEEVVRAKYRVGTGSHPQLIRVQLELAQLDDRLIQLRSLRPVHVATLNSILNRSPEAKVQSNLSLAQNLVLQSAEELAQRAMTSNPILQSNTQRIEQARIETQLARKDGYPDLTVGLEYIVTNEAANPSIAESGDDPIMLTFGINLPIWREKYDAKVRQSIANRLSQTRQLDSDANTITANIYKAWFEHTDAARRVALYQDSLIPKAQESLSASLVAFRTGQADFLDLLDTQRTLIEFGIQAQRAQAEQSKALAALNRLVGEPVNTTPSNTEVQP